MPYKANEARRHKIPRARYKVRNWPEYDRALQQRGSLTVWVTPEALAAWHSPRRTGQRGRPRDYSDVAIETGHLLRLAFGRPWRQTEDPMGAIGSISLSGRVRVLNHSLGSDHPSPLSSTSRTRRYPHRSQRDLRLARTQPFNLGHHVTRSGRRRDDVEAFR